MNFKSATHQVSTGLIVGLSSVVYAISHGALLFSAGASHLTAVGISAALITASICAIGSCFFKEKTFVMGTDSSTVSVMAGMVLALSNLTSNPQTSQATILTAIFMLSLISSGIFYLVARLNLANFVRFVPFSVMAGLLASTGWLMCSGALMIISGVSLSMRGLTQLMDQPNRPELLVGIAIALALQSLSKKISAAVLIPLVIIFSSFAIQFAINSAFCQSLGDLCSIQTWLFSFDAQSTLTPAWKIPFSEIDSHALLRAIPAIFVIAFVGVITILLSVASLELSYKREFNLNQALQVHAGSSLVAALMGGFLGIISTGRTTLNRLGNGGVLSTAIVALLCLLMLVGGGGLLAYIPRAAMGGVILFLGLSMLKNWVWDQRKVLERTELLEIGLILVVVANLGYLAGFGLGIAMACVAFVIACSKNPLISFQADLSVFASSVVRHERHREWICKAGAQSLIFKLKGYIFFGSASNLELIFNDIEKRNVQNILLDFSEVLGIDRSAIGVFHRILRRDTIAQVNFYFIYSEKNQKIIRSLYPKINSMERVSFYPSLDLGVEAIEDHILASNQTEGLEHSCFDFLSNEVEEQILMSACELVPYMAGQNLCNEGDHSSQIYFIKEGSLEIVKELNGSEIRLTKLSSGAMAGEMAFYSGEARSATIRSSSSSWVYVLSAAALQEMRNSHPGLASKFDLHVIKKLANALIRANKLIASIK